MPVNSSSTGTAAAEFRNGNGSFSRLPLAESLGDTPYLRFTTTARMPVAAKPTPFPGGGEVKRAGAAARPAAGAPAATKVVPGKSTKSSTAAGTKLAASVPVKSTKTSAVASATKLTAVPGKSTKATTAAGPPAAEAVDAAEAVAEAERLAAETAAETARLAALRNGDVRVRFNHYNKVLTIQDGKLSAEAIDEELALSFVFKNCRIHVCPAEDDGKNAPADPKLLKEEGDPVVFVGLEANKTYWVMVEEDVEELAASAARQSIYVASTAKRAGGGDDGIVRDAVEGCSCLWGNPCVQPCAHRRALLMIFIDSTIRIYSLPAPPLLPSSLLPHRWL